MIPFRPRPARPSKISLALMLILASFSTLQQDLAALEIQFPEIRVGVFDASRNGVLNLFESPAVRTLRGVIDEDIQDEIYVDFRLVPLDTLEPGSLSDLELDMVFLSNANDMERSMLVPLSEDEQAELRRFVEAGGTALLVTEEYTGGAEARETGNRLITPFEMELAPNHPGTCSGFATIPDPGIHPITDGPFEFVESVAVGPSTWLADLGPHASPLILHPDSGQPLAATIDRDVLGPGSGRVFVMCDAHWLGDEEFHPAFYFSRNRHFFLNLLTWLLEPVCEVPASVNREIRKVSGKPGDGFSEGDIFEVTLHLEPGGDVENTCGRDSINAPGPCVLEYVPEGWEILTDSVSGDGEFRLDLTSPSTWGRWFVSREQLTSTSSITYRVIAGAGADDATFDGHIAFVVGSTKAPIRGKTHVRPVVEHPLRIATLDFSRHENKNLADGPHWNFLRESIRDNVEELGFDRVDFLPLPELTADGLSTADFVILHNRNGQNCAGRVSLSSDEQEAFESYIREGGSALVIVDAYTDDGPTLLEPLEVRSSPTYVDSLGDLHPVSRSEAHPTIEGPFGRVTSLRTAEAGWFEDLGPHAHAIVSLSDGSGPLLAAIERNSLGEGSGRVLLSSDSNWLGNPFNPGDFFYFSDPNHEALFLNTVAWLTEEAPPEPSFRRGDSNGDGVFDLTDPVSNLVYQFNGTFDPPCLDALDFDDSGVIDLSDPIGNLTFQFLGGSPPAPPGLECGVDPGGDELSCEFPSECS